MRAPRVGSGGEGSAGFGGPLIIVILVLMLGGTVYLWRKRYMRRKTAYLTLAVLGAALIYSGISLYMANL